MCPTISAGPTLVYRRVMIFIDGGYRRENFKKTYLHDRINFSALYNLLKEFAIEERRIPEVIRVLYYDAIVDALENPKEFKKQDEYFSKIRRYRVYEVRLARIKRTGKRSVRQKKQKQKGADVKLAVDMITKALMDHYDIAILLTGDDDFLDLVKAVKDFTDKRVYGAFFPGSISEKLRESFDKKKPLTKDLLDRKKIAEKPKRGLGEVFS